MARKLPCHEEVSIRHIQEGEEIMSTVAPITDWGTAVITSLTAALAMFLAAIPKVIGFLIILLIGWFIASLLAKAVSAVLRSVKFNDLAQRAGLSGFVQKM